MVAAGPNWFRSTRARRRSCASAIRAYWSTTQRVREPRARRLDARSTPSDGGVDARAGALRARRRSNAWPRARLRAVLARPGDSARRFAGQLASEPMGISRRLPNGARRPTAADRAVLRRLLALPARARAGLRQTTAAFDHAHKIVDLERAPARVRRAVRADVGDRRRLGRRPRARGCTSTRTSSSRRARSRSSTCSATSTSTSCATCSWSRWGWRCSATSCTPPRRRGCCPGFTDSVADFTGVSSDTPVNALFNPYAAVPSMHVGFALMLAAPMIRMARRRVVAERVGGLPAGGHARRARRQPTTGCSTRSREPPWPRSRP